MWSIVEKKLPPGLSKLFQGKNSTRLILILGIAGMALILLSSFLPKLSSSKPKESGQASTKLTAEEYTEKLEKKVTDLAESISGAGKVKVMITLENGVEYVYANSEKKTTDNTQDYEDGSPKKSTDKGSMEQDVIVIDGQDGKQALVVTQREPTVKGVVVVCEGGGDINVKQSLTDAITTALNLKSNRVTVVQSAG